MSHQEFVEQQEREARLLADAILQGEIGVLLGVRQLVPFLHTLSLDHAEELRSLLGIDSVTDHLPLGPERQHWAADALAQKDTEIADLEDRFKESVLRAVTAFICRLESPSVRAC